MITRLTMDESLKVASPMGSSTQIVFRLVATRVIAIRPMACQVHTQARAHPPTQ